MSSSPRLEYVDLLLADGETWRTLGDPENIGGIIRAVGQPGPVHVWLEAWPAPAIDVPEYLNEPRWLIDPARVVAFRSSKFR